MPPRFCHFVNTPFTLAHIHTNETNHLLHVQHLQGLVIEEEQNRATLDDALGKLVKIDLLEVVLTKSKTVRSQVAFCVC